MNRTTRRSLSITISTLATTLFLTSCGGPGSGVAAGEVEEEGDELVAAAEEEGELSFYCGAAPDTCEGVAAGFMEKYDDITVNVLRATSPDITARYSSEKDSNARTADVILHSDIPFIAAGLEDDLLTSFGEAGYLPDDYPEEWLIDHEGIEGTPYLSEGVGIAVNTDLVPESERPTSWMDLTDPKWKGKMNGPDETTSSFSPMYGTVGDNVPGFIEGMRDQDIFGDTGGMVSLTESLGAGQYAVQTLASGIIVEQAKESGAPVEFIVPEPGISGPAWGYTLNPEPDHPSAQKLFAQFVASPEGSEVLSGISPMLAAAYLELDFEFFPPNWDYYAEDGMAQIVEAMSPR